LISASHLIYFFSDGLDTEASIAFFDDPDFLHNDVTSQFAAEYLEQLFVGEGKGIKLGLSQVPFISEDNDGNLKRTHNAVEVG
jgi:hypothetical protein